MSDSHVFLGFLPTFLIFFRDSITLRGDLWFLDQNTFKCGIFRGKVVIFLPRSYFFGIFWIFRGLFEFDPLQ